MSKIGIVISREYSTRVKKKSFLVTTLLVPILMAAMIVVPMLIAIFSSDNKVYNFVINDKSGVVASQIQDADNIKYHVLESITAEAIKRDLKNSSKYDAVIEISPLDSANNASVAVFSSEQININLIEQVENEVNRILRDYKLESYDIPDIENVLQNIKEEAKVKTYISGENEKEDTETQVTAYMAVGYISSFIIYMFIFMFGSMVMNGVIEEKTSRIIEVIVSSVKPVELMIGKIIGIALVALTQFVIWIVFTGIIVTAVGAAVGGSSPELTQQIVDNQPMTAGSQELGTAISDGGGEFLTGFMSTMQQMNILGIIGTFIIYFVLGYLLYASMFAAVGASVDNTADTQQLLLPVTIPLIIGLFIMLSAFQNPNSTVAIWGSIIPFTSPMVMVARFAYGVPAWQYILSVVLLILTFLFMAWLSAKIYRVGILSYGKKASWKEIVKWIKFKD